MAKLHNAAFWKVQGSHSAKASLGALHRCAPSRVSKTGVMQNCLRWSGRQSSALPGRFAPYVQSSVALVLCWRCGLCQALRALFLSAASPCIWCLPPAHPWGLLASQHRPRGLPVRPPRGLPQNRAPWVFICVSTPAKETYLTVRFFRRIPASGPKRALSETRPIF